MANSILRCITNRVEAGAGVILNRGTERSIEYVLVGVMVYLVCYYLMISSCPYREIQNRAKGQVTFIDFPTSSAP